MSALKTQGALVQIPVVRSPPPTPPKKGMAPSASGAGVADAVDSSPDIHEPARPQQLVISTPPRPTLPVSTAPLGDPHVETMPAAVMTPQRAPPPMLPAPSPYSIPRTPGAAFQPLTAAKRSRGEDCDISSPFTKIPPTFTTPFRGMKNLGNTCYVNAVVTALRSVPILNDIVRKSSSVENAQDGDTTLGHCLQEVFDVTRTAGTPVEPTALCQLLRTQDPGLFIPDMQQDAHEALVSILRMLSEQSVDVSAALQGSFINTLTCPNLHKTEVAETQWVLSLAVPEGQFHTVTLQSLLQKNTVAKEDVEHTCETCGSTTAVSLRTWGASTPAPKVLILHLKRFTRGGDKIHSSVVVAPMVKLPSPHVSKEYRLVALVSHLGHSVAAGHYVCDFFHEDKEGGGKEKMYTQDDAVVSEANYMTLGQRQTTGYIAFYIEM